MEGCNTKIQTQVYMYVVGMNKEKYEVIKGIHMEYTETFQEHNYKKKINQQKTRKKKNEKYKVTFNRISIICMCVYEFN